MDLITALKGSILSQNHNSAKLVRLSAIFIFVFIKTMVALQFHQARKIYKTFYCLLKKSCLWLFRFRHQILIRSAPPGLSPNALVTKFI